MHVIVCSSVHARVTWSKHKTLIALSYSHNYTGEDMVFLIDSNVEMCD